MRSFLGPILAAYHLSLHVPLAPKFIGMHGASPAAGHCFAGKTDGTCRPRFSRGLPSSCWLCIHRLGFPEHRQETSWIACPSFNSDVVGTCFGDPGSIKSPLLNQPMPLKKLPAFERSCHLAAAPALRTHASSESDSILSQLEVRPVKPLHLQIANKPGKKRNQAAAGLLRFQIFYP